MGSSHSGVKIVENPDELYEYGKYVRPSVCEILSFKKKQIDLLFFSRVV
jgi:hypothetical protein